MIALEINNIQVQLRIEPGLLLRFGPKRFRLLVKREYNGTNDV